MCINLFLFRLVFKKNVKQLLWKESSTVLFNMAAQPRGVPDTWQPLNQTAGLRSTRAKHLISKSFTDYVLE